MFFSITQQGFFTEDWRAQYEAAGTWPEDAVEIDAGTENFLREALAAGSTITRQNEEWVLQAPEPISFDILAVPRMNAFRQNRETALNRLSGIGFAALLAGRTDEAKEIAAVRSSLLDIPALPQVQTAGTLEALDAALNAAWRGAYAGGDSSAIAAAMAVGAGGGQTRPS